MIKKLRTMLKKGKVLAAAALIAVSSAVCSVAASAEDVASTGFDFSQAMTDAGTSIQNQFGVLVTTLIPVVVGIMITGLAIFGVFTLIKLAKKIFGKVAG